MTVTLKSKDGQAIRKLIPLTTLSEAAFNKLCSQVRIEEGPKGTVLFKQGDQKNEFVYLLEGVISLQAAGMEMDTITGGSEEARFALAHQIPRKVFAVAKDKIRFIRVNAEVLNSTTSKKQDSVSYEVSDIPEESSGDWMTTLLKSPIFQRLPAANLQKVLTSMEAMEVKAGELVVKQGDPGDYYYIIKKGRCSLTRKPSKIAKEIKLAELKTTDTFGEDSLISGAPRNVNITMLTDGILLRLSKESFLQLVKKPVIQTLSIDQAIEEVGKGAILLDVRTPDSFERGRLEGSCNIPFFSLRMQLSNLDPAKKLIVICEDGTTSEAASFLLIRFAFDAVVLKGGFNAVPEQYLGSFSRCAQASAAESGRETEEAAPIASAEDEKQALDEALQIIALLQKQLQDEQEKRNAAEQDQDKSNTSQETFTESELELRKQIEALSRELETASKEADGYRNQLTEAENKLASSNQASAKANRESDELKSAFSAQLESLESELKCRQSELETALNRSKDDKKRIESLGESLKDQEKQLSELKKSVREKTSKLEKEISSKRVIEANLSRIQKETSSQIVTLGEQRDQAKRTIAELEQQLEQSRQCCVLLEKQKSELSEMQSGEVESLLGEKQAFEMEAAGLKHRLEQIVDEKQRMESEAEHRIDQLQQNLERLEQQIAEKNHDLEFTQDALRKSEQTQKELSDQRNAFEAQVFELRTELENASSMATQSAKEIAELTALTKSLEEDAGAEQGLLKTELTRIEKLNEELESAKSGIEKSLLDKTSINEYLERELQTANDRISRLELTGSELSKTIETRTEELQSVHDELTQTRQSRKEFQEALDRLSAKHENTVLDAENERNTLLNKIRDLEQSLTESGDELQEAIKTGQTSEADYSSAIETVTALKQDNAEMEAKIAGLTDNIRQKDRDFEALRETLAQTQRSEAESRQKLDELSQQYEQTVLLAENVKSDDQERMEALERMLIQSTADLEETHRGMSLLRDERDDLDLGKQELEAENASFKQDLESLAQLPQQLIELQNAAEQQREEMKRIKEAHACEISDANFRHAELEDEVAALHAENSEIQERMGEKARDLAAMEEKLFAIRKENAVLKRRLEGFKTGHSDFAENAHQPDALQSEIHRLKKQCQAVVDEKAEALNEVASLRKENSEIQSLLQKLTQQFEQNAVDETIHALKTELAMVREQAENDVKTIKAKLDQSQKSVDRLEQELKAERQCVTELQESSLYRLSLNPALTAVDRDLFDRVEEDENRQNNPKQSAKTGIGKRIADRFKKR